MRDSKIVIAWLSLPPLLDMATSAPWSISSRHSGGTEMPGRRRSAGTPLFTASKTRCSSVMLVVMAAVSPAVARGTVSRSPGSPGEGRPHPPAVAAGPAAVRERVGVWKRVVVGWGARSLARRHGEAGKLLARPADAPVGSVSEDREGKQGQCAGNSAGSVASDEAVGLDRQGDSGVRNGTPGVAKSGRSKWSAKQWRGGAPPAWRK